MRAERLVVCISKQAVCCSYRCGGDSGDCAPLWRRGDIGMAGSVPWLPRGGISAPRPGGGNVVVRGAVAGSSLGVEFARGCGRIGVMGWRCSDVDAV